MAKRKTEAGSLVKQAVWSVVGTTVGMAVILGMFGAFTVDPLERLHQKVSQQVSFAADVEVSEDNDFYWPALRLQRILVEQLGASVVFSETEVPGAAGTTNQLSRTVTIDGKLHWTARFETLVHEAAHLLQPKMATRMDGEVFAEAVAYLVAIHDGDKDALRRSSRYLAGQKASLHILSDYRPEILRAAKFLE